MGIFSNVSRASRILSLSSLSSGCIVYAISQSFHGSLQSNSDVAQLDAWSRPLHRKSLKFPSDLPKRIDWREKGAVTSVKNQNVWKKGGFFSGKGCGNCWAYSSVGAVEGLNKILTGDLTELSVQQLTDCSVPHMTGCEGASGFATLKYIRDNGILAEKDYPTKMRPCGCKQKLLKKGELKRVTIDGLFPVDQDEISLLRAIARQPVMVCVAAYCRPFLKYTGGVYYDDCLRFNRSLHKLDHMMLAVGYCIEEGEEPYIILKNSWGTDWGEMGYMRIAIGTIFEGGVCGVHMNAVYPLKREI